MSECMKFPNTFKEFIDEYSFKDRKEIYTNGSELIQTSRVMQGYEHFIAEHDQQIRNEVINEVKKAGATYCANVSCNMECIDCEHGSLMRAIEGCVENKLKH